MAEFLAGHVRLGPAIGGAVETTRATATADREKQIALISASRDAEQKAIAIKVAADATSGAPLNPADASTIKVFGTEFYLEAFRLLMEIIGPSAYLKEDTPGSVRLRAGRPFSRLRSMES